MKTTLTSQLVSTGMPKRIPSFVDAPAAGVDPGGRLP